jgi:hypothetical protein
MHKHDEIPHFVRDDTVLSGQVLRRETEAIRVKIDSFMKNSFESPLFPSSLEYKVTVILSEAKDLPKFSQS